MEGSRSTPISYLLRNFNLVNICASSRRLKSFEDFDLFAPPLSKGRSPLTVDAVSVVLLSCTEISCSTKLTLSTFKESSAWPFLQSALQKFKRFKHKLNCSLLTVFFVVLRQRRSRSYEVVLDIGRLFGF